MGRKNYIDVNKNIKRILKENSIEKGSGCIEWQGRLSEGYGVFWKNGIKYYCHRESWSINNQIIQEGKYILHSCDNRKCINPEHLREGTHLDNIEDMVKRKGFVVGEEHGMSTLTKPEVIEIKNLINHGVSNTEIGKMYEVTAQAVSKIKTGKTWGWLHAL